MLHLSSITMPRNISIGGKDFLLSVDLFRAWALEKEIGRIESVGAKNFVKSHYPPNISAAMELALDFGLGFGLSSRNVPRSIIG